MVPHGEISRWRLISRGRLLEEVRYSVSNMLCCVDRWVCPVLPKEGKTGFMDLYRVWTNQITKSLRNALQQSSAVRGVANYL